MNHIDKLVKDLIDYYQNWYNQEDMSIGEMRGCSSPHEALFKPIFINSIKLKNRIIMGPMGNIGMAHEGGKPSQKMIEYFIERAKGGAGLLISGMIPVDWDTDPSYEDIHDTGIFPRIDKHRAAYSAWRELFEGVHAFGAKFFIQLAPGMGRVGNPECLTKKKKLPVSASWNPNWYIPQIPCRKLANWEIKRIIKRTAQAAADAKELGADGVHLHGHSGYLIEQMTDKAYNRRKLGRFSNPQNFGLDMVRAIRKSCGDRFPIHYRIDLSSALKETYPKEIKKEKALKKFKKARTLSNTLDYMENLVKAGVDAFDVDLGAYENWWLPHPPNSMPPGMYLEIAKLVKKYFKGMGIKSNRGAEVPIVAVGKMGFPYLAEEAVRDEKCDMVMLSRALLADPYWPNKVFSNKIDEIRPCIGDHEGCLGQLAIGGHPHCTVNPRTAFEHRYKDKSSAEKLKRIAVIGAGPAGVTFAVEAARRGHFVTIFEKEKSAGGNIVPGAVPKIKYELGNYKEFLNNELSRAERDYGLIVKLNTYVDLNRLQAEKYHAVVTCTGSKPFIPRIDGVENSIVNVGVEFLKNPFFREEWKNILVIGGSDVGCEIAHMLACEKNKKVTIAECEPYLMKKTCTSNRNHMLYSLKNKGVKILNCARVEKIEEDGAVIAINTSKSVPNPYNTWNPVIPDNVKNPFQKRIKEKYKRVKVEFDMIMLCTGAAPNDHLYYECVNQKVADEIYNLGDSIKPGRILESVKGAYALATHI